MGDITWTPYFSSLTLKTVMPNCPADKLVLYHGHLHEAMLEGEINTVERMAAFLGQLALESGEFRYMEEIASGAAYEGRRDLGNTMPGDGKRFKGRGPIQITGRYNYQQASLDLQIDLVNNPERAADPDVGFRIAVWYWTKHNLNELADLGTQKAYDKITRKINGGYNGKHLRDMYWKRALEVLRRDR